MVLDSLFFYFADSRSEIRSRGDRDIDNQQALQAEEKDVVSSVATVLSDLCGPGEWMPMAKLHNEVCYANDKNLYLCNFDAVFLSHALVSPNSFLLLVLSRVYKLTNEPHGYIIKVMKFLLTT